MKKLCMRCGKKYDGNYNYCPKCAVKLEKDYNRCSDPQNVYCERSVFQDDDIVCGYCGLDTTYEKARKEKQTTL